MSGGPQCPRPGSFAPLVGRRPSARATRRGRSAAGRRTVVPGGACEVLWSLARPAGGRSRSVQLVSGASASTEVRSWSPMTAARLRSSSTCATPGWCRQRWRMRWCGPFPAPPADPGTPVTRARHPIVMVGLCALMVGEAVWSMRNDLIPTVSHHAVVVLSAVVMVLVGELVGVHMPSGRVLAPISSAVGFTLVRRWARSRVGVVRRAPGVVIPATPPGRCCRRTTSGGGHHRWGGGSPPLGGDSRSPDPGSTSRAEPQGVATGQPRRPLGRGGTLVMRRVDRPRDRAIVDRHAPGAHPSGPARRRPCVTSSGGTHGHLCRPPQARSPP